MFGKNELDSLDEFKKAWDAPESKAEAKADTDKIDATDFDAKIDQEIDKPATKAVEPEAAPVVENKTDDSDKGAVQTTPAVEPAKLSFKEAFAQEYKRYKADPNSPSTFDWNGKKYALKLASEVKKPTQAAKAAPIAKPESKPEAKQDDHTAAWNDDGSHDKAEAKRLTPAKQSTFGSVMKAFLPPSVVGGDSSTDKPSAAREPVRIGVNGVSYDAMGNPIGQDAVEIKGAANQVASVKSPAKTSSPSGRDYSGNAKAADSTKAIADKMGVDSKTLLPKQETRTASSGKGSQG